VIAFVQYVVVVVSLKAGMETRSWTIFTHLAIWGSISVWVLFFICYSLTWRLGFPIGADMSGLAFMVFSSPVFWIGLIVVPLATLLPDLLFKS